MEEILQKRAKEVQREMAEEESQENALDIMLEEIEVVVATPVPGPTQMAGPNRNRLILFIYHIFKFSFFKNVVTQIPDPTRMVDPNQSPIYSDHFYLSYQNILIMSFSF